ncbi:hypothetical protein Tco_0457850 [Tanacetum coccineum]
MEENNSIDRSDVQKNLYRALLEAYNSDKDLLSSYGEVVTLKRGRDDQDKDEEPFVGFKPRVMKRTKIGKDELINEATQKKSKSTSSSKGATRSLPKSSGKSAQEEEHDPRVDDLEEPFHQEFYIGNDDVFSYRGQRSQRDGTLNHVRTSLNDIATGIQMEYLPKRKWSKQDKQRARVMIKAIDKKLKDRRLMRSLEKFVGGRPYRGDLRLLQRTI